MTETRYIKYPGDPDTGEVSSETKIITGKPKKRAPSPEEQARFKAKVETSEIERAKLSAERIKQSLINLAAVDLRVSDTLPPNDIYEAEYLINQLKELIRPGAKPSPLSSRGQEKARADVISNPEYRAKASELRALLENILAKGKNYESPSEGSPVREADFDGELSGRLYLYKYRDGGIVVTKPMDSLGRGYFKLGLHEDDITLSFDEVSEKEKRVYSSFEEIKALWRKKSRRYSLEDLKGLIWRLKEDLENLEKEVT